MNILFVNNFRGRGGGEEFLRDLLPALIRKGMKVGLVCRPNTPLVDMFQKTSVRVHRVSRSGKDALPSVFRIAKIIRDEGYEIVNIQRGHDIIQSWVSALLAHTKPFMLYTLQVPEYRKSRFLLGRMNAVIAVSRYIKEKLVGFYPAIAPRVAVINYGIDVSSFQQGEVQQGELRKRFQLSPDTKIVGTVGDLWKNQIEFLDALREIRKQLPNAQFAIVASESGIGEVQVFKERAKSLGLSDAVLWVGRLSKDEMRSFYADIDIAVSTHRKEGFGIWILEALAMGKPVVAYDAGGIRDPLEGCPAGVLVNGGSRDMAAEIIRILKEDSLYKGMSEAGPSWVAEKFTKEQMIENYYQYFNDLVSKS